MVQCLLTGLPAVSCSGAGCQYRTCGFNKASILQEELRVDKDETGN